MNNETFYLGLVKRAMQDAAYEKLKEALGEKRLGDAFELAHGLKGVTGNLALTPIYEPVAELTEHLRGREDGDYEELTRKILSGREALLKLCE